MNHNEIFRILYENASRTGLRNLCIRYHGFNSRPIMMDLMLDV